jgi:hypothetical protein
MGCQRQKGAISEIHKPIYSIRPPIFDATLRQTASCGSGPLLAIHCTASAQQLNWPSLLYYFAWTPFPALQEVKERSTCTIIFIRSWTGGGPFYLTLHIKCHPVYITRTMPIDSSVLTNDQPTSSYTSAYFHLPRAISDPRLIISAGENHTKSRKRG